MFRVVFYAENRKLGDALEALKGLAHSMEPPMPVVNAEPGPNGKIQQKTASGSISELVIQDLSKWGGPWVGVTDLGKLGKKHGSTNPRVGLYLAAMLKHDGYLKQQSRGKYIITSKTKGG